MKQVVLSVIKEEMDIIKGEYPVFRPSMKKDQDRIHQQLDDIFVDNIILMVENLPFDVTEMQIRQAFLYEYINKEMINKHIITRDLHELEVSLEFLRKKGEEKLNVIRGQIFDISKQINRLWLLITVLVPKDKHIQWELCDPNPFFPIKTQIQTIHDAVKQCQRVINEQVIPDMDPGDTIKAMELMDGFTEIKESPFHQIKVEELDKIQQEVELQEDQLHALQLITRFLGDFPGRFNAVINYSLCIL